MELGSAAGDLGADGAAAGTNTSATTMEVVDEEAQKLKTFCVHSVRRIRPVTPVPLFSLTESINP